MFPISRRICCCTRATLLGSAHVTLSVKAPPPFPLFFSEEEDSEEEEAAFLLLRAASFGKTKASLLAKLRLEERAKDVEEEEEEEQDAEQQELLRCRCRTLAAAAAAPALAFVIPPDVDIVVIARISFLNKPRFCACYMCHSRRGKCRLFGSPILSRRHFLLPLSRVKRAHVRDRHTRTHTRVAHNN
jgi:hypothetical protein